MKSLLRALLIPLFLLTGLSFSWAQTTYRTIATFTPNPAGSYPSTGLILGPDGNYYGTTEAGGAYNNGTFFRITSSGVLTVLASFNPKVTGRTPAALLLGSDGNFYGSCTLGGASNYGTIFKATKDGMLTALHTFSGYDGEYPSSLIQGADSALYTVISTTGSYITGQLIIKLDPTSGNITTVNPGIGYNKGLVLEQLGANGAFYGDLHAQDGINYSDTLVEVSAAGVISPLDLLGDDVALWIIPGPNGSFYGSTNQGTYPHGSIFQFNLSGALTPLVIFPASTTAGGPFGGFIHGQDGNFYGGEQSSTLSDPYREVLFRANPTTGTVTTVATGDGFYGLVQAANGDLLWETGQIGSILKLSNGAISTLYDFSSPNLGGPNGPLIQGMDGNFYGTTNKNGLYGFGGVYKVTPAGQLSTLASFMPGQGGNSYPLGLTQGSDGTIYGVNSIGGYTGIIYTISPTGTFTLLTTFPGGLSAIAPVTRLIQGADGNFYGLTAHGGTQNQGTFYQVTPAGKLTVIASLDPSLTQTGFMNIPVYQFLLAKDGNFYAITQQSIFKITPAGNITSLVNFPLSFSFAANAFLEGPDGNFYGLGQDQTHPRGYLFKLTPQGVMSTVYNFGFGFTGPLAYLDTSSPTSLALGHDGNFYVTAPGGYGYDSYLSFIGLVLQITPDGVANSLPFGSSAGNLPTSIIPGADGTLYGATAMGGSALSGNIFNISPGLLRGTIIGTPGTYNISQGNNTIAKAFDRDVNTFFDAPSPGTGDWVGLDLGTPQVITTIEFVPRTHFENRMIGGVFQGSNTADFSSGVVNLAPPITTYPGDRFNTINVSSSLGAFRYVRYLSPAKGFGNINELEFFGNPVPPHTGAGG